jgi:HJR/Mrr/RecB family endonuclease
MPVFTLLSVLLVGFALYLVVASVLGLVISGLVVVLSIVYGRVEVQRQIRRDHDWHALEGLRLMSGYDFEKHVAELYRRLGYHTQVTRMGGDQGVDVIADNGAQRIGIQCKQRSDVVGNEAVQQAMAGRAFYDCSHAAVICTTTFSKPAQELAARGSVQLIEGNAYAALVNQFHPLGQPEGLARFVPRGRPKLFQITAISAAIVVLLAHFAVTSPRAEVIQRAFLGSQSNVAVERAARSTFADAVNRYYNALNGKRYRDAYAFLSPNFRSGSSYDRWLAGYAFTSWTNAVVEPTADPNTVSVTLRATENFDNKTWLTTYYGTLRGIRDENGHWLIDAGSFKLVNRT